MISVILSFSQIISPIIRHIIRRRDIPTIQKLAIEGNQEILEKQGDQEIPEKQRIQDVCKLHAYTFESPWNSTKSKTSRK